MSRACTGSRSSTKCKQRPGTVRRAQHKLVTNRQFSHKHSSFQVVCVSRALAKLFTATICCFEKASLKQQAMKIKTTQEEQISTLSGPTPTTNSGYFTRACP
ncbi:hypothetical protein Peur_011267 [Populus x canadensis]